MSIEKEIKEINKKEFYTNSSVEREEFKYMLGKRKCNIRSEKIESINNHIDKIQEQRFVKSC